MWIDKKYFSFAPVFRNLKNKKLYILDFTGTGVLFFEFHRILCSLRHLNKQPFFWLFENVASMPISAKEVISRYVLYFTKADLNI